MLNGKAKEEFEKWYNSNIGKKINVGHLSLYTLDETMINSVIVSWFDSIGIYIEPRKYAKGWGFDLFGLTKLINENKMSNSRTEATTQAIEKASEIFNQLNK
jgi:hypothetical protein